VSIFPLPFSYGLVGTETGTSSTRPAINTLSTGAALVCRTYGKCKMFVSYSLPQN